MSLRRSQFLAGSAAGALTVGAAPHAAFAADIELREVVSRPFDYETPLRYLRSYITPEPAFFVRSHFGPPTGSWPPAPYRLKVEGTVGKPLSLSVAELRAMPSHSVTAVIQCAGNGRAFYRPRPAGAQWGWGAVGNARWTGVRVKDVLERAGIGAGAAHLGLVPADRAPLQTPPFNRSIPIAKALDDDTILAYAMNGAPLSVEHGGPVRIIVPGWAGDNSVKWLLSISPQAEETHGFYMDTAYRYPDVLGEPGQAIPPDKMHHVTDMPIKSIVTNPLDGEALRAGKFRAQGIAFSSVATIARVEVSQDGGTTWRPAELGSENERWAWRMWQAELELPLGKARISSRAIDTAGNVQPASQVWNPSGYFWNVYHTVDVAVNA